MLHIYYTSPLLEFSSLYFSSQRASPPLSSWNPKAFPIAYFAVDKILTLGCHLALHNCFKVPRQWSLLAGRAVAAVVSFLLFSQISSVAWPLLLSSLTPYIAVSAATALYAFVKLRVNPSPPRQEFTYQLEEARKLFPSKFIDELDAFLKAHASIFSDLKNYSLITGFREENGVCLYRLAIKKNGEVIENFTSDSCSISIDIQDGKILGFWLISQKDVVGQGSESQILKGVNILSNELVVKRTGKEFLEHSFFNYFMQKPHKNVIHPQAIFTITTDKGAKFYSYILPYYSLGDASQSKNLSIDDLFSIYKDLTQGLCYLHQLNFSHTYDYYTSQSAKSSFTVEKFPFYHSDIKPENILLRRDTEGRIQAIISDFGVCCYVLNTPYYNSPEGSAFYSKYEKNHPLSQSELEAHLKTGQPRDMWALGLTILKIAKINLCPNPNASSFFPPIEQYCRNSTIHYIDQREIEEELVNERIKLFQTYPTEEQKIHDIFILIQSMVRVNPRARYTANKALNMLLASTLG